MKGEKERMKKVFSLFILIAGISSMLFASSITGWSGKDSLSLSVTYVVPSNDMESIRVGFYSVNKAGEAVEETAGSLEISEAGSTFVNENEVYVYWRMNYSFPLEITLKAADSLKGTADDIDWFVSWTGTVDGEPRNCLIGGDNGYGSECCVFRRTSVSKEEERGYAELTIETEDIRDKPAGWYSSSLLLTVTQI